MQLDYVLAHGVPASAEVLVVLLFSDSFGIVVGHRVAARIKTTTAVRIGSESSGHASITACNSASAHGRNMPRTMTAFSLARKSLFAKLLTSFPSGVRTPLGVVSRKKRDLLSILVPTEGGVFRFMRVWSSGSF